MMASGFEISPQVTGYVGGCSKDSAGMSAPAPAMEDHNGDTLVSSNQVPTGKPPRNISVMRHCTSSAFLCESDSDLGNFGLKSSSVETSAFVSVFHSGSCSEKGPKQYMEDEYICVDNLEEHLGDLVNLPSHGAFYGVFDGHGGVDAASFIKKNLLNFIVQDSHFPNGLKKATRSAFVKADHAFADATSLDKSSGTTALTALIFGRNMLIANAGDCRAVLGKRGRAIELSKDDDMNVEITGVPGLEGLLRRVDLPEFCRVKESSHPALQFAIHENQRQKSSALILDTIYELDAPCLSHMANMFPKIYTLGPLHSLLHSQIGDVSRSLASHGCLWKGDPNCMTWLDSQPTKSVLYVSFGSLVTLTHTQIIEFWYGLINSGHPFLWVIKSDITSALNGDPIPMELEIGTKERGYIVNWVSQEEVLAHKSVGGFFTHSGWNSTLESIVAAVPMICWPYFGDQHITSRNVSEKWKIGLQLKRNCDRKDIETIIRTLLEFKMGEIQSSMDAITKLARDSVVKGGSSNHNLEMLIQDIRNMHA